MNSRRHVLSSLLIVLIIALYVTTIVDKYLLHIDTWRVAPPPMAKLKTVPSELNTRLPYTTASIWSSQGNSKYSKTDSGETLLSGLISNSSTDSLDSHATSASPLFVLQEVKWEHLEHTGWTDKNGSSCKVGISAYCDLMTPFDVIEFFSTFRWGPILTRQ